MKSPQEIEELKMNWIEDPCYDIEDTEGFEAHRVELTAFRQRQEKIWERKNFERKERELKTFKDKTGIKDKAVLEFLKGFEERIVEKFESIEDRISKIEEKIDWR